ncbi:MAG: acetate/propionate family kinase [bacterium]|nr:acetate/propionate family kinase [bacterium]
MILVLNCGSQSIKYKLFNSDFRVLKEKSVPTKSQRDYDQKLVKTFNELKSYNGLIKVVGHRVVHGGPKFRDSIEVTPLILKELRQCNKLAPLHNPFNLLGISVASKVFPGTKQVAVFDTGFYKNLPEHVKLYPLPEAIRKKYGFQRFGFHGISHKYAAKLAGGERVISCHLGGGSSITAIKDGKAIDTSMGFTPLEGLTMMSRCGDLDPGIVLELAKVFPPEKMAEILNRESGLKGICGLSDMKEILKKVDEGNEKAILALKVFVYRIQKYIGAYYAILGGCDTLVFTGSIGAGSKKIRQMICRDLAILNNPKKVKIKAIKPNEELAIAQEL